MPVPGPLFLPDADAPARPDWPEAGRLILRDEAATEALAIQLARLLATGDALLLSGALGAGKTHLARALIRARLSSPAEPVPSPSFTLVQIYDAPDGAQIWHADLYRLGDPGDVLELGLDEALDHAICLIEWPDRLAPNWPEAAVMLHLERARDESRVALLLAPPHSLLSRRLIPAMRP